MIKQVELTYSLSWTPDQSVGLPRPIVSCMVNSGQYSQSSPVMADWGVAESRGAVSCP